MKFSNHKPDKTEYSHFHGRGEFFNLPHKVKMCGILGCLNSPSQILSHIKLQRSCKKVSVYRKTLVQLCSIAGGCLIPAHVNVSMLCFNSSRETEDHPCSCHWQSSHNHEAVSCSVRPCTDGVALLSSCSSTARAWWSFENCSPPRSPQAPRGWSATSERRSPALKYT